MSNGTLSTAWVFTHSLRLPVAVYYWDLSLSKVIKSAYIRISCAYMYLKPLTVAQRTSKQVSMFIELFEFTSSSFFQCYCFECTPQANRFSVVLLPLWFCCKRARKQMKEERSPNCKLRSEKRCFTPWAVPIQIKWEKDERPHLIDIDFSSPCSDSWDETVVWRGSGSIQRRDEWSKVSFKSMWSHMSLQRASQK